MTVIRDMIYFGILFAGILLVRKAAWGRISRRAQYFIWLFAVCFLLFSPFFSIESKYSLENIWLVYGQTNAVNGRKGEILQGEDFQAIHKGMSEETLPEADGWNKEEINILMEKAAKDDGADVVSRKTGSEESMRQEGTGNEKRENMLQERPGNGQSEQLTGGGGKTVNIFSKELQESVRKWAKGIAWAVAAVIFFIVLMRNFYFAVFCRKNRVLYRKLEGSGLKVYLLEGISSPFLLGKGIYVEAGMVQDEKMLRHIMIHEYCHFKHGDNFWAIVRTLCLALHWYNPLVWLANGFVKRDCELACDEAVLAALDEEEGIEYGYTLLAVAKYFGNRAHGKRGALAASTMSGDMKRMKERIQMIHAVRKKHILATVLVTACMLCLTGCAFMKGDASLAEDAETRETASASDRTEVERSPASDGLMESSDTSSLGMGSFGTDNSDISSLYAVEKAEDADRPKAAESLSADGAAEDFNGGELKDSIAYGTDDVNKIYNVSAKYCGGRTYIASDNGLYVIEDGSNEWKLIFQDAVALGAMSDEYLFFYSYPENIEDAAIMSVNILTGEIGTGFLLGRDIYSYHEMYYENGNLYIQMPMGSEIGVFEVRADGALWEKDILLEEVPDSLEDAEGTVSAISPAISRSEGFPGTFYTWKGKDEEYSSKIYFCKDDSSCQELEGVTDAMVTSEGVIGRDTGSYQDIYLWDIGTGERKLLYSPEKNGNKYFGYNTYDEKGVYGLLQEGSDSFYISRIGWDGTAEKLFLVEKADKMYWIHVRMSVIGDWIYYYNPQSARMERRSLKNPQIMEGEQ